MITLKHIATRLLLAATVVSASSCVHEFPKEITPEPDTTVSLTIAHKAQWGQLSHFVTTDARSAEPMMRYIVRTYPADMAQHYTASPISEQVVLRPTSLNDFTIDIPRYEQPVDVWVWADHVDDTATPLHYDAAGFDEVTLTTTPHPGCDERRDAFCGGLTINPADTAATITVSRPVARYEFIATDLEQFLQNEGATGGLEDFSVEFVYTGYLTTSYNMFIDMNLNSKTGISFPGSLRKISDTEASLGFDHVFTTAGERAVSVQAYLITPAGRRRAISPVVNVPIRQGVNTTVRGAFLTVREQGGIDIDFDFSGDINIII